MNDLRSELAEAGNKHLRLLASFQAFCRQISEMPPIPSLCVRLIDDQTLTVQFLGRKFEMRFVSHVSNTDYVGELQIFSLDGPSAPKALPLEARRFNPQGVILEGDDNPAPIMHHHGEQFFFDLLGSAVY